MTVRGMPFSILITSFYAKAQLHGNESNMV